MRADTLLSDDRQACRAHLGAGQWWWDTDIDGISIVPELLGAQAAGRKQKEHEYLYFEFHQQTAVRMGNWKAIEPRKGKGWELYDLSKDITEQENVADRHSEILDRMKRFAQMAHQPVHEGTYSDQSLNQEDREAKYGDTKRPARRAGRVESLPREGLIPGENLKVARVSSEAKGNGKLAACALDGDPRTHWHTRFQGKVAAHPHELVVDLGRDREILGVRYLARQDGGWNGAVAKCEFYVGDSLNQTDKLVAKTTFKKTRAAQQVDWKPVHGRFVRLRILSEVNGGPWASIAELGVIGK